MWYILALSTEGFVDQIDTYALISGLFTSLYSAGAFIGPSVGGLLVQSVAFRKASMLPLSIEIIVLCLSIINYALKKNELSSTRSGYQYIDWCKYIFLLNIEYKINFSKYKVVQKE